MKKEEVTGKELVTADDTAYEAPAIETVVQPADMEREFHYAGAPAPSRLR